MNLLNTPLPTIAIPILAFGLFLGVWIAIVRMMRRLVRMTDTVPAGAGPRLDRSRWGNGNINGAQAKGCVRIERYATGVAVRMHPVFGNGLIWMPQAQTERSADDAGRLVLTHGRHRIALFSHLAEFVAATPGIDAMPTHPATVAPAGAPVRTTPMAPARDGGSRLSSVAFWIAVLMLVYVGLRSWAPGLVAPIEAMFRQLS
jgi:hypothetical protein